jgi:hypothetical protein
MTHGLKKIPVLIKDVPVSFRIELGTYFSIENKYTGSQISDPMLGNIELLRRNGGWRRSLSFVILSYSQTD